MAELATVRRVTLDDGTVAELDGDTLTVKHSAAGESTSATPGFTLALGEGDKDALVWLLRGAAPRRDRGTAKGPRASRKNGGKGLDSTAAGKADEPEHVAAT